MLSGNGFRRPKRREVVADIGVAQLHHPFGTGDTAQFVPAEIGQPRVGRKRIDNQILGGAREHRLAAVGEIAQPRRPVDRRADVITLIAQLHLSGMHTDAQPDRGQRRPLQLQCARSRLGRAGERDHKAVALTLLDRPHPAVGGEQVG